MPANTDGAPQSAGFSADLCALRSILALPDRELFARADFLRERAFGRRARLCAIINIRSGNCAMDCGFCAQSRHNAAQAPVYGLLPDDELRRRILALCEGPAWRVGLVASGPALRDGELERLCSLAQNLPPDVRSRLCVSLGRLGPESLGRLKAAGITRYHHNLESCAGFYPGVCSTQLWEQRRQTAQNALSAGLELCCGGIFGLGESWPQRIELAVSLAELGVDNVPLNFLDPVPGTPLGGRPLLSPREALRIIAVFRLALPAATLRVCGGRTKVLGALQSRIFRSGANAMITGDYLTTRGAARNADMAMLAAEGFETEPF